MKMRSDTYNIIINLDINRTPFHPSPEFSIIRPSNRFIQRNFLIAGGPRNDLVEIFEVFCVIRIGIPKYFVQPSAILYQIPLIE